eukprot:361342-Pleurochrysis_carterae.AAC.2
MPFTCRYLVTPATVAFLALDAQVVRVLLGGVRLAGPLRVLVASACGGCHMEWGTALEFNSRISDTDSI